MPVPTATTSASCGFSFADGHAANAKTNDFVRPDNGAADEWSVERKIYWYSAPDTVK